MLENKLELTKEQFESFINLPLIKDGLTYYIKDFSIIQDGKVVSGDYEKGVKFAGIEYYVAHE